LSTIRSLHNQQPSQVRKTNSAEENESQTSSQKFFPSNSTITSLDSAHVFSRRATNPRHEGSIDCRVYFPRWLVQDTKAKQLLISHLNNQTFLQRICSRTDCIVTIQNNSHILISRDHNKYVMQDIRKAKEELERAILEHIRHDGSSGRLFYDMAWSCDLLHPRGVALSSSVMQRNPFTRNNEMGWMNIVELPYERLGGDRKCYHGHFLISRNSGVLGRLKRETRCEMKICCDEFKVPTKLCAPYVFVMGVQPGDVDRAVEIVKDEIRNYLVKSHCVWADSDRR